MKNTFFLILFVLVSCSHFHSGGHQHAEKAQIDHSSASEFKVTHGGKDYYFQTETEKDAFIESLEKEKKRAQSSIRARQRRN